MWWWGLRQTEIKLQNKVHKNIKKVMIWFVPCLRFLKVQCMWSGFFGSATGIFCWPRYFIKGIWWQILKIKTENTNPLWFLWKGAFIELSTYCHMHRWLWQNQQKHNLCCLNVSSCRMFEAKYHLLDSLLFFVSSKISNILSWATLAFEKMCP